MKLFIITIGDEKPSENSYDTSDAILASEWAKDEKTFHPDEAVSIWYRYVNEKTNTLSHWKLWKTI